MTSAAIVTAGSLFLLAELQWDVQSNTDDRRLTAAEAIRSAATAQED